MIEPRLAYNYAILDENNRCAGVKTYSYEVPLANFIAIPTLNYDYYNKYYDYTSGKWYYEAELVTEFIS